MWLDLAKKLHLNGRIRVVCCRDDTSMIIGRSSTKFWCYCHRCKKSLAVSVGVRSIKDIMADKRALEELNNKPYQNRCPKLTDIPPDAAVWFLKYGISVSDVKKYGIGYSNKYKRVCIPLANGYGMQMRAVYPYQEPKYLNVEFKPNTYQHLIFDTGRQSGDKFTVVVEDVLSAIKIRLAGFHAVCCIGTSIRPKWSQLQAYKSLVGWFDSDLAGKHAFGELKQLCGLTATPYRDVRTEHDPKVYTRKEIQRILNGIS